uniref:Uncharacterized protein n=1 Tax=Panagrolaimus sp. ES5 TaxID=591445 RepID=A0AC34FFT5_9BILA
MEQIQSRRSSLESATTGAGATAEEGTENSLKLNESFYSEFSQPICGGDISMELSQISGWSAVNAKWDISLPLDLNFDDGNNSDGGNLSLCESEQRNKKN